jgi:hypothetical protein
MLVLVVAAPGLAGDQTPPLTNEAVVRMFVQGVSTEEIVEAIRTHVPRFDLSAEMEEELRLAGLPEEILRAMRERQAEQGSAPDAATTEQTPDYVALVKLRIVLNPGRKPDKAETLKLRGGVGFQLREELGLGPETEGQPFEDLAIYLACRSATHVPDHWRGESPLGRDFISMPRHRMLVFISGAESKMPKLEPGVLALEIPSSIEVALEPDDPHDLMLGIAVQAAGRFYSVAGDTWEGLVLHERDVELRAKLLNTPDGQLNGLTAQFDRTASP